MKYNKDAFEFWTKNEKVVHIIPPSSENEFPEGWDVPYFLKNKIGNDSIVEVGCGYGRLVGKFNTKQYRGFDINPNAILKAKKLHPDYSFNIYKIGSSLPPASWLLYYTVLLHISDEDILNILHITTKNCSKVIIGEIMDRKARKPVREGKPPVWNRDKKEYIELMQKEGFKLIASITMPWREIDNRFTILIFKKKIFTKIFSTVKNYINKLL